MDPLDIVPARSATTPERGAPHPLGSTPTPAGTNFAVFSRHATRITLSLFAPGGVPRGEFALSAERHRTGDVWHVFVPGVRAGAEYAWRTDSNASGPEHAFEPDALLLDPYAKGVAGSEHWGVRARTSGGLRSVVCDLAYDWGDDRHPGTAFDDSVIYETHVRAFTRHASSLVRHPGTFAGLAERIPYLCSLGVTAVQLMPVAEFDETDNPRGNPVTGERLWNTWGYAPLAFMAPRTAYAAEGTAAGALREFRDMVRALHAAGIEVILDVVFNHTGEGSRRSVPRSWRGLDRASYFLLDERGRDLDYTGCGHSFACARPVAADMILDALRFWARDMRVDGFRFDLASTLTRGERGEPLVDPPLVRRIAEDPLLAHCKLIAEPWDAGGLYQVGCFPQPGRFAELNGRFRDDVRDWLRGAARGPGALATRLAGSPDLYAGERGPGRTVNFVTCHDGFTLADLVSHEHKHNVANGEANRDGSDDHRSWNGGVEGESHDPGVRAIRDRQARNAAALTLLSQGALLWLWGDETLRTQFGNNNAWCQDGPTWWQDWQPDARAQDFTRFVAGLMRLRREHAVLRAGRVSVGRETHAMNASGSPVSSSDRDRNPEGRRLAMHIQGDGGGEFLLLVNGGTHAHAFPLPPAAQALAWVRVVDTAAPPPADFTPLAQAVAVADAAEFVIAPRSVVLLGVRLRNAYRPCD